VVCRASRKKQRRPVATPLGEPKANVSIQLRELRTAAVRHLCHERKVCDELTATTIVAGDRYPREFGMGSLEVRCGSLKNGTRVMDGPLAFRAAHELEALEHFRLERRA
jgi:hypothetical protein